MIVVNFLEHNQVIQLIVLMLLQCSDNTDATDNTTCNGFLPGCITNGQGCVVYNTPSISMKGTQAICDKLQAEQFQAFEKINVITHQVILQQIISKLKLVLLLKTRLIAHVDHFQKVVFKMVMEGVLIQKQQLVLVILELQHFAKMQLLEVMVQNIILEHHHQNYARQELAQIIQRQQKMMNVNIYKCLYCKIRRRLYGQIKNYSNNLPTHFQVDQLV
ncbi:unnamed protein product [Paramecium sonneborni]|uniref:Secreted protein n=1 Tax=Paramecium sonneborni TaxID=65129 RepID=A0A8S1REV1_9CILI|nr:unnamed protein product [Paramecium sonneborni]